LSVEDLEKLRALGYVALADGSRGGKGISPDAADPKDKLAVYQMISAGSKEVAAGRYTKALPILQKVIQVEPGMRMAGLCWSLLF
jgi:hypothetical protein